MTIPTPLFETWRADAIRRLAGRGLKTELAQFLTTHYGRTQRSWQRYISAILGGEVLPNAEIAFAMNAWFATQKSDGTDPVSRRKSRTRP